MLSQSQRGILPWAIRIVTPFVALACSAGSDAPAGTISDGVASDVAPGDGAQPSDGVVDDAATGDTGPGQIPDGGVCVPGQDYGCTDNNTVKRCAEDGMGYVPTPCIGSDGELASCINGACGTCLVGKVRCNPKNSAKVQACDSDGETWVTTATCDTDKGKTCFGGTCEEACAINIKAKSYIGCSYWAVDLDNAFVPGGNRGYYDAAGAQFAVVVSNPSDMLPSIVKVYRWGGVDSPPEEVTTDSEGMALPSEPLGPGELRILRLPKDNGVNSTVQAPLAWKIESTAPITAYQFNPLDNVNVFSNDASLLLPDEVLGCDHVIMSREQSFDVLRGFLTIAATQPGETHVTITFSGTTVKTLTDNGIKQFKSGEAGTFVLSQWDVLNIETDDVGADLTGTRVVSDRRIAVFGGSEAANAPNTNHCDFGTGKCAWDQKTKCKSHKDCSGFITCCADHLEMQMFPTYTWGGRFVAVKLFPRGGESDSWRVLALNDGTKVTTLPPIAGVSVPVLNKGEWFEFESKKSFEIIANDDPASSDPTKRHPILVGHFMQSQDAPDPNEGGTPQSSDAGTGDPAFLLAIPTSQWRDYYVFLTPNVYDFNYISIAAPASAGVVIDDVPLVDDFFEPVSKNYKMARVKVDPGVHSVRSSDPKLKLAVDVYGYSQYVSYGYPAGLDLHGEKEKYCDQNPGK